MTNIQRPSNRLHITLLVVVLLTWGCQADNDRKPHTQPLKLSLAMQPAPYSGLLAIADEKGYFKEVGLEVAMDFHPSGRSCLEAVSRGQAEVGTVADIAFAAKVFEEPSIRILASIGTTQGSQIIARKDRNIQTPADLKGKRVGFTPGTTSDYFLYAFLTRQNIPQTEIMWVEIPAERQTEALVSGEVDAASVFDIYGFEAKKKLGNIAVSWDAQNNLSYHWLLVAREGLTHSPEKLERLLRALIKARDFALSHDEEARRIIARKWNLDPSTLEQAWQKTRLNVSLGQSIVTSLEQYTLWHIDKAGGKPLETPEVIKYLHPDILDAIDPQLVTIYR
jgi:ABC-type nitrate/sulfonate/bicarbonate transport system substrate-binding protein